jgi:hypothetical protein
MADVKITALAVLTAADPINDAIPIVDVSDTTMAASGTTKRISVNNILGASGTATLASATITGDLTVRTTGLVVNTTGVGIGIVPTRNLSLFSGSSPVLQLCDSTSGTTLNDGLLITQAGVNTFIENAEIGAMNFRTSSVTRYSIDSTGVSTWSVAGSTAMTLNSTGLGVGVTPSAWATFKAIDLGTGSSISGASSTTALGFNNYWNGSNYIYKLTAAAGDYRQTALGHAWYTAASGTAGNAITFTQAMTLDASGNLLVGTTNTSATAGPGFKAQYSSTVPQFAIVTNEAGSSTALSLYNVNAAAYRFYVNNAGTVFATNTTISAISDARFKENVQDIDVGLGAILALKPRKFDWKAGKGKDIKGDRGFIAQEFEQVFPQLVDEWKDNAPEGEAPYKSVRQDLIPVLVKAIQELTARVQTLEAR